MRVLGISAFYHDSAAALVVDGEIVAAAQEERFTRRKHDAGFPRHAIEYCLTFVPEGLAGIDQIVFYEKPFLKFERLLETYLAFAPRGLASFQKALPLWLREKLYQKNLLLRQLRQLAPDVDCSGKLRFTEHHQAHAASAFFASPFQEAVVLTLDGAGEWTTTSVAIGRGSQLEIVREIHFPHSLGLLYSAFTYYTGFRVNSGEYKLMGLAPYGEPRFRNLICEHLIDVKPDGSFRLNLDYFDYCTGLTMTNRRFDALFGQPPRRPDEPLTQFHMDVAASIQTACGFSPRPVTPGAPWAPRWPRAAPGRPLRAPGVMACRGRISDPSFRRPKSKSVCAPPGPSSACSRRKNCSIPPPRRSPANRRSGGFRAGWSSARAPSATGRSWPMRGRRACSRP